MIDQFIADLKSIPKEEYRKFFIHAKKVAMAYPLNWGIDCFARGETVEWAFIKKFSQFIDIEAVVKKHMNDPDGLYKKSYLFDVKLSKESLLPQKTNPNLVYSHVWDFKKTQTGVDEFVTKSQFYLLLDAYTYRAAVLDAEVIKSKDMGKNSARITFPVKTKDITMVYDGINDVEEVNVESKSDDLKEMIWESV